MSYACLNENIPTITNNAVKFEMGLQTITWLYGLTICI